MVKPGDPEWDELAAEGYVLTKDDMKRLTAAAAGEQSGGGQSDGGERRSFAGTYTDNEADSEAASVVEGARRQSGLPPTLDKRGAPKIVAVRITHEAHQGLRDVSASYGWVHGGEGNVTALMEAIGQGKLVVRYPSEDDA